VSFLRHCCVFSIIVIGGCGGGSSDSGLITPTDSGGSSSPSSMEGSNEGSELSPTDVEVGEEGASNGSILRSAGVAFYGVLSVTDVASGFDGSGNPQTVASAQFYGEESARHFFTGTDTLEESLNFLRQAGTSDRCDARPLSAGAVDQNIVISLIGAGEVLTVSNRFGTVTELQPSEFVNYGTVQPLDTSAATGLQIDVPGDVFPAIANIVMPEGLDLRQVSPVKGSTVTSGTEYRWMRGSDGNSHMFFSLSYRDSSNQSWALSCTLTDDGQFVVPASFRAAIEDDTISFWTLFRVSQYFRREGNVLLQVIRNSTF